jgi:NitT/TauT family transport system ATP-binding protein
MSASEALEVRGISKVFVADGRELTAMENVSLNARPSEIVSIIGPSGCGKSTLLRMIAGFDFPTSGRLELGGRPIGGPGADRGIVFQHPALFPWLTVYENVAFGPKMRGAPQERYRPAAEHYLKSVGLTGFERHYPYQLSGGMRQRVQIARVLIGEPRILLMDEPFGALDYQTRLTMQKLLLDLWEEYRPSVFFVTHDVEEAIFISDRVYVMSARPGRILEALEVGIRRPRVYDEVSGADEFVRLKLHALKLLQH